MTFVIQRARKKRLAQRVTQPNLICSQSQQHSQQLMMHFDEVIRHFSADSTEAVQLSKDKLAELYRHHQQCFDHQRVTGPGEQ